MPIEADAIRPDAVGNALLTRQSRWVPSGTQRLTRTCFNRCQNGPDCVESTAGPSLFFLPATIFGVAAFIDLWRKLFTPEWLTALGTVGATVLALVLALWGEKIGRIFVRPKLSLMKVHVGRPESEAVRRRMVITGADAGLAYFFRLSIKNTGNAAAHDVQVFLQSAARVTAEGSEPISRFTPMNLLWSYRGNATLPTLLPGMPPVYCDFAHVEEPMFLVSQSPERDAELALDVEVSFKHRGACASGRNLSPQVDSRIRQLPSTLFHN